MFGFDAGFAVVIVMCCTLLCGVVFVLTPLFQIVEIILQLIGTVFDLAFGIIGAGPEGCFGCLVLLFGCILCSALSWIIIDALQTCGTSDAVNFCRLIN